MKNMANVKRAGSKWTQLALGDTIRCAGTESDERRSVPEGLRRGKSVSMGGEFDRKSSWRS